MSTTVQGVIGNGIERFHTRSGLVDMLGLGREDAHALHTVVGGKSQNLPQIADNLRHKALGSFTPCFKMKKKIFIPNVYCIEH